MCILNKYLMNACGCRVYVHYIVNKLKKELQNLSLILFCYYHHQEIKNFSLCIRLSTIARESGCIIVHLHISIKCIVQPDFGLNLLNLLVSKTTMANDQILWGLTARWLMGMDTKDHVWKILQT